ncbi:MULTISPECIES: hypothetical protein [Amycolatopsis methanolica group]|uniref:Uncharacterized protein n=2 Tax=Amycolatopsis TaxID=1813 RepID=A0A076MTU9_AMYME|nr:hypothetical protein [Amycolatopsis methanolica]AIJ22130.1 hypothetical protein AMETH_2038 [Amycolatopsis methanolica 239]
MIREEAAMRLGRKLAVGVVEESKAEEVTPVEEPRETAETPEPERPAPVTADR